MHRRNLWKQPIQKGTLTTGGCPEQFPQERPRYCQTYSWGKVCEKLLKTNVPPFSSDGRQLFSFRLANVREDEQLSVLEPTLPKDGHQVRVSDMSSDQTGQDLALRPQPGLLSSTYCKSLSSSILLYISETWTLLADTEKRIKVFEKKYTIRFSYMEHKIRDYNNYNHSREK